MPRIAFTPNLERHVSCPPVEVVGTTVAEVLTRVFADNPRLRGYVLDDQGRLRKHVVIFLNGEMIADRRSLTDPVSGEDELFVMQALSGG